MPDFHWFDYLRMVTIATSMFGMYYLSRHRYIYGPTYDQRMKDLWWFLMAALFVSFEFALEQIINGAPWAARGVLNLLANLLCLRVFIKHKNNIL